MSCYVTCLVMSCESQYDLHHYYVELPAIRNSCGKVMATLLDISKTANTGHENGNVSYPP